MVMPGGRIDANEQNVVVSPSGNFRSVEDIEDLELRIPESQLTVRLRDLVTVERGFADPPRDLAYFNGKRAIVISVSITPGVNSVAFGEALTAKLGVLESQLPIGYELEYATFQPDLVEAAVNGGLSNVYQTIGIVLAVVMVFLGIRTGLIVGSFVPLTMLMGLIVMRMVGIELERVSIASAIIALGMLVDNGIVIAEDIRSRLERGEDRRQACIETGKTLSIPLLTSSLTTILAFMPMLLMDGQTGEYAFSLPMVVIVLLLSSWFLSMYVTPAMCFWFMKVEQKEAPGDAEDAVTSEGGEEDPYSGGFYGAYRGLLKGLLRARVIVTLGALAAIVLGGWIGTQLVREFFGPSTDRNQFLVYVDRQAGDRIDGTDETVQRLNAWLSDKEINPEVTSTVAYVGSGGPRFFLVLSPVQPNPHVAFLVVDTASADQVPKVMKRLRERFLTRTSGGRRPREADVDGLRRTGFPGDPFDRPGSGIPVRAGKPAGGRAQGHARYARRAQQLGEQDSQGAHRRRSGAGTPRRRHLPRYCPMAERAHGRRGGHRIPGRRHRHPRSCPLHRGAPRRARRPVERQGHVQPHGRGDSAHSDCRHSGGVRLLSNLPTQPGTLPDRGAEARDPAGARAARRDHSAGRGPAAGPGLPLGSGWRARAERRDHGAS